MKRIRWNVDDAKRSSITKEQVDEIFKNYQLDTYGDRLVLSSELLKKIKSEIVKSHQQIIRDQLETKFTDADVVNMFAARVIFGEISDKDVNSWMQNWIAQRILFSSKWYNKSK